LPLPLEKNIGQKISIQDSLDFMGTDLNREREHLAEVDRHIAQCKKHIAKQQAIIQQLALRGQPREGAKEMLAILENSLKSRQRHREMTLEAIRKASSFRS
jgi:hypothetical protein